MVRPRKLLHQSDAIITVSKTTARDCMETFNVPPSRIHAVTPGVLPPPPLHRRFIDGTLRKFRIPHRYILALSAMDRRKNLDGLIAAVAQLRHPTALVIAGIPGSTQRALARHIRRSPARNRIHCIGTVSENEKHALLERATCFAYPSHWEGFGFPPLEAFSHGTPVVASAQGALPEILSTNALLVDPLDPTAIARALDRVLNETAVARRLSSSGRTHVDRYQWVGAAKQVRDLIHMTIEH
jgi:glycosyltransferase involved in cell wall biosynthesis